MHAILEDILGLPSGGSGGPSGIPAGERIFRWGLTRNAPNPFTGSTEIRFEVARTGRVRLAVYDTLGRLVRALVDDNRCPGGYGSTWDGWAVSGEPAAAGIYLCRLGATGFHATRKMLLVK
jgi:hypothetical protein